MNHSVTFAEKDELLLNLICWFTIIQDCSTIPTPGATYNKTNNLIEWKGIHLVPSMTWTRMGNMIFRATWTIAVRTSSESNMFEISHLYFCSPLFYWSMEHDDAWYHATTLSIISELTIFNTEVFHKISADIRYQIEERERKRERERERKCTCIERICVL